MRQKGAKPKDHHKIKYFHLEHNHSGRVYMCVYEYVKGDCYWNLFLHILPYCLSGCLRSPAPASATKGQKNGGKVSAVMFRFVLAPRLLLLKGRGEIFLFVWYFSTDSIAKHRSAEERVNGTKNRYRRQLRHLHHCQKHRAVAAEFFANALYAAQHVWICVWCGCVSAAVRSHLTNDGDEMCMIPGRRSAGQAPADKSRVYAIFNAF